MPKHVTVEVFATPQVSCYPVTTLGPNTLVEEKSTLLRGHTLWVETPHGWVASQFASDGIQRVQLQPEAPPIDTSVQHFLLDMNDRIGENVTLAVDNCPVERLKTDAEVKDFLSTAFRRREEIRALPTGHYDFVRRTWEAMQEESKFQGLMLRALQEHEEEEAKMAALAGDGGGEAAGGVRRPSVAPKAAAAGGGDDDDDDEGLVHDAPLPPPAADAAAARRQAEEAAELLDALPV